MERRIKQKTTEYVTKLKTDLIEYINTKDLSESDINYLTNYITNYAMLELTKEDFVRRKRVKNVVPLFERCHAKRANGEQCTRRSKDGDIFCGTHSKGQPHGVIPEEHQEVTFKKITVQAQDIKGIIYYLDLNSNVYDPNDIINGIKNPKIIAKYEVNDGVYTIPEFNI